MGVLGNALATTARAPPGDRVYSCIRCEYKRLHVTQNHHRAAVRIGRENVRPAARAQGEVGRPVRAVTAEPVPARAGADPGGVPRFHPRRASVTVARLGVGPGGLALGRAPMNRNISVGVRADRSSPFER